MSLEDGVIRVPRSPASRGRWSMGQVLALLLAAASAVPGAAVALETDQFYAWTRPIADSTAVLNAKMNLEIALALEELARRGGGPASCDQVAKAVRGRLELEIFQPIELWVLQSPLVDRVPADGEEVRRYFGASIYRRHGPFDVGMWIPPSPTLEVGRIRFGSDKLAHFASSGWKYRNAYLRRRERGMSEEEAERAAIRWGLLEERSINGVLSTGILSRADLEANYQGMRFYLDLCQGADPLLHVEDGQWRVRRRFDVATHVSPEWDESYHPSVFSRWRWRKVQPEMVRSCDLLDDPMVVRRFEFYRSIDTTTPTEQAFDSHVAAGKLPDPEQYSIAANCPGVRRGDLGEAEPEPIAAPARESEEAFTARILAVERERERRLFAIWGLNWSHPRGVSGSVGFLSGLVPRTHDCRELCDLRGVFGQLLVGEKGGQASLGYARVIADGGDGGRTLSSVYLAFGARVSVLRAWGEAPRHLRHETLVGAEGVFTITRVNFTAGAFARTSSGGDRWVFTGSVGFGF